MNNITKLVAVCLNCGHFQSIHEGWRTCLGHTDVFFDCIHCGMHLNQTVAEATVGDPRLMAAAPKMLDLLRESERLFSNFKRGDYPDEDHHNDNIRALLKELEPESATLIRFRAAAVRSLDAVKHCFDSMKSEEMAADHRLRNTTCDKWSVRDMNLIINANHRINNPIA
jgi:hypothetical protein